MMCKYRAGVSKAATHITWQQNTGALIPGGVSGVHEPVSLPALSELLHKMA